MKDFVGGILVFMGIAFGVYAGVWWAFIGGIIQIINEIKAPELSAVAVALGIAKVMFAGLIGYVSAVVAMLPGFALLNS